MRIARIPMAVVAAGWLLHAQQAPKLGDNSAGSRAQPAHVISLRDPEGDTIQPGDRHPLPFSTTQTCGECHDAATVSRGWHFNAMTAGVPAGRNGQPWLLVDRETATQLPLSYRAWPGTYRPQQIGMGSYEFATHFGGRTPGGIAPDSADQARWRVSGALEVNCLACHDASPAYDQAEYSRQVSLQNFRYAAAAASGLASVSGSSKEMPDVFDYLLPGSVEDSLQPRTPKVEYAASRFLAGGKMVFDIVRAAKSQRCYYCHTNTDVEFIGAARWKGHEDVHVARGIACVECHRNGLDHNIARGVEGAMSCEGCHAESSEMGAPHPRHQGIPPLHFAKLTCTACHSGPLPAGDTRQLKNGMTHGLGEFNVNKNAQALPHIYYPVFARQQDGRIGPNRLVWPAFWGKLQQGAVTPLAPGRVKPLLEKANLNAALSADGSWPKVDEQWVARALHLLDADAVYIAGGKLHRLDNAGKLVVEDHAQAQPYLWPIAHDVRPAAQALGAKGCEDCHSGNAPVFFGNVAVDSPLATDRVAWKMNRFEKNLDVEYQSRLARSWRYRGWLKAVGLVACGLLLLFLLTYAMRGIESISAASYPQRDRALRFLRVPVNAVGLLCLIAATVTGYSALLTSSGPITGDRLVWHVTFAPAFALATVAVTLFWADKNRFAAADFHHPASVGAWAVPLRKLFFWIAVGLSVPAMLSILAAMFPLFEPAGQQQLFQIHRSLAPYLAASGLLFACFAVVSRGQRSPQ